jgi:ribosome-associated translation inhibitor RaiA
LVIVESEDFNEYLHANKTTAMNIQYHHLHHTPSPSLTSLIERQFGILGRSLRIDEARVTIERRLASSPAFRFSAHLVTPGPDVYAEALDHTLRAAVHKTVSELEDRIASRKRKQMAVTRHCARGASLRGGKSGAR